MKFALKAELKFRPYLVISIIMVVTIFYIGFIIRTSEISYQFDDPEIRYDNYNNFKFVLDVAWLTIITMTTVGYGDLYAVTFFGRTFSVVSFILGNCLISLIVVVL
jgi:voltage-gated potassium channel